MKYTIPFLCVFGSYDETILSNKVILNGIKEVYPQDRITFVHAGVPKAVLYSPEHLGIRAILQRIIARVGVQIRLASSLGTLLASDVILVLPFGLIDLFIAGFVRTLFRKKVIYVPQNSLYDLFVYAKGKTKEESLIARVVYELERFLMCQTDVVVFATKEEADDHKKLLNLPHLKTKAIPLGASDHVFYPAKDTKKKTKQFNVLFYGEYNDAQGAPIIVEAATLLKKEKNIRFTMIGDGKLKAETVDKAKNLKADNITFLGWVKPEELLSYLQKADISLGMFNKDRLSTRVIPNKVYQGLAVGVAVITGNAPVVSRWIRHKKEAYLVEMNSPKSLARGISYLQRFPTYRQKVAAEGYQLFIKRFASKPIGNMYKKLVQEVTL